MNFFIVPLVTIAIAVFTTVMVMAFIELISILVRRINERRPRYRVHIYMRSGKIVMWRSNLEWNTLQKHLPKCGTKIADDTVMAWRIEPP